MVHPRLVCILGAALWISVVDVHGQPAYKGMSYTPWSENALFGQASNLSIANMAAVGVDTVALNVWAFQDNETSTQISLDFNYYSASLPSISYAISEIHRLGMKVMLKPNVELRNGNWRGFIQPSAAWFQSYTNFMNDWADFATSHNVEMLSIGTEYKATESWTSSWQNVATHVRARYTGDMTYSANWDSYSTIAWWNSLDYIGIDAYFPISSGPNPTLAQLQQAWNNHANTIASWRTNQGLTQPVLFTEVGYRSVNGATQQPWNFDFTGPVNLTEQANAYQALISVMTQRPWFDGAFWWNWETNPQAGGPNSTGYTPQNKPAEQILMEWYGGTPEPPPRPILDHRLNSWEAGLEQWNVSGFQSRPVVVTTSSNAATHGQRSLAVTQTGSGFSWNVRRQLSGDDLQALQQSLAHRPQDYVLDFDVIYRDADIPNAAAWLSISFAVNDGVGGWSDVHGLATTNGHVDETRRVQIPLTSLPSLRSSSNWIDMIMAMNGSWGNGAATVYFDNLRLVNINPSAPADLNQDGTLDASDWSTFMQFHTVDLSGLSSARAFTRGDLNGDGVNDFHDFLIFGTTYDRVYGAGAFEEFLLHMPEPVGAAPSLGLVVLFHAWRCRHRPAHVPSEVPKKLAKSVPVVRR